jgi:hypothetical protein
MDRFILTKLDDAAKAEPILLLALKLDPSSEVALFNMGLLQYK